MQITPQELAELLRLNAKPESVPTGIVLAHGSGKLQPDAIDPVELLRCLGRVSKGHKIDAIRIFRAITGLGLKEAKDALEATWPV